MCSVGGIGSGVVPIGTDSGVVTGPQQKHVASRADVPLCVITDPETRGLARGARLCSTERVESIFQRLNAFSSSKQLFDEISTECAKQGLKLAFIHKPSGVSSYAFRSEASYDNILYIIVPEEKDKKTDVLISVARIDKNEKVAFLKVKIVDGDKASCGCLTGLFRPKEWGLEDGKTVDGYIIGHELSHVRSFLQRRREFKEIENKIYGSYLDKIGNGETEDLPEYEKFVVEELSKLDSTYCTSTSIAGALRKHWERYLGNWEKLWNELFPEQPSDKQILAGLGILFDKVDEARNLLGIEFTGEFQLLQEVHPKCVRIPYATENSKLKDDHKLKDLATSIVRRALLPIRTSMEEMLAVSSGVSACSSTMRPSLRQILPENIFGQNYSVIDVSKDGNCGVWAVLQALHPTINYMTPTPAQRTEMEALRQEAADLMPQPGSIVPSQYPQAPGGHHRTATDYDVQREREILRNPGRFIGPEHLHFIGQIANREIVIFNAANNTFMRSGGAGGGIMTQEDALNLEHILLHYDPTRQHYQLIARTGQ